MRLYGFTRNLAHVLPGIVLLFAGCGPQIALPPAEIGLPGHYAHVAPTPVPDISMVEWWHRFHDPVLDRLVAAGLAQNVSIQIAEARLREARANARAAGVPLSDELNLSVQHGETLDTGVTGLSISLSPFGGRQKHAADAAMARLQAAQYGQQGARLQLLAQLTQAYVDLRFQQAQLRLGQLDLASRKKTLASLQAQMDRAAATKLDIVSGEALVAETEARLPALTAAIARQTNHIATLLGQPAGTLGIDLGYPGQQPVLGSPRAIGVPADLVRRRPDIAQAERLYAAAVAEVGQAQAAFYPSLSLSGQITAPIDSGLGTSQSMTAGLSLPLLSLPRVKAQSEAAQARAEQAYLTWRLAVLSAVEDVESGLAAVAGSHLAAQRSGRVVTLNLEALDLSRKLLDSHGDVTALDLLDRERAVSQARVSLAQSQRDYANDMITLYVALGLGPDPEGK